MRPLLQQASRSILEYASSLTISRIPKAHQRQSIGRSFGPSICIQCQIRAYDCNGSKSSRILSSGQAAFSAGARSFSSSRFLRHANQQTPSTPPKRPSKPSEADAEQSRDSTPPSPRPSTKLDREPPTTPNGSATISKVSEKDLPSYREGQRWGLSKRFSRLMDELQAKAIIISQQVNHYTGTDYSGIAALRREIKEQEQLVLRRREAVDDAKEALDDAHAQQASSQKEVVGLLERKHSWAAHDLERYMSLIRSEHVNDQAVHVAKDKVLAAENALEETRAQLEKRERAVYHEEQIWSDTIRRNSTWVTIGLMGFNAFLLLLSLIILEPWRRRRLVREIKKTLDERAPHLSSTAASLPNPVPATAPEPAVVAAIDNAVQPAGVALEKVEASASSADDASPANPEVTEVAPVVENAVEAAPIAEALAVQQQPVLEQEPQPPPSAAGAVSGPPPGGEVTTLERQPRRAAPRSWPETVEDYVALLRESVLDLFSERVVSFRMVDVTTIALEGAAAGAALMGLVFYLLKPHV